MRTKRVIAGMIALFIAFAGLSIAGAQGMRPKAGAPGPGPGSGPGSGGPEMRDFKLEQAEIDKIEEILKSSEETISKARAEIQVVQAKIARIMLDKEPSTEQIGALVKESFDWEYKVRMAQIERQLGIRAIVGVERWNLMFRMGREFKQVANPQMLMQMMDRNGISRKDAEKWTKFFLLMRRLN